MTRMTKDEYFMSIAVQSSKMSTCARRQVGCVIVDKNNRIMSTGYNGVPPGVKHCTDEHCEGATIESGKGLSLCQAIHAEANALLFCNDINKIEKIYVTNCPCRDCVKLILCSSCKEVIYKEPYNEEHDNFVTNLLNSRNIVIRRL